MFDSGTGPPRHRSIILHALPEESHLPPKPRLNGNHLPQLTCNSSLSRSPGRLKNQARAKLNNFGWGLVVVSHILNPFRISLEFKRETPLPTLVQSPGLHQLCLVVLQGAALAGTRVRTVLMLLLL